MFHILQTLLENEMKHLFLVTSEIFPEVFFATFCEVGQSLFETVSATSPGTGFFPQSASPLWTAYVTLLLATPEFQNASATEPVTATEVFLQYVRKTKGHKEIRNELERKR